MFRVHSEVTARCTWFWTAFFRSDFKKLVSLIKIVLATVYGPASWYYEHLVSFLVVVWTRAGVPVLIFVTHHACNTPHTSLMARLMSCSIFSGVSLVPTTWRCTWRGTSKMASARTSPRDDSAWLSWPVGISEAGVSCERITTGPPPPCSGQWKEKKTSQAIICTILSASNTSLWRSLLKRLLLVTADLRMVSNAFFSPGGLWTRAGLRFSPECMRTVSACGFTERMELALWNCEWMTWTRRSLRDLEGIRWSHCEWMQRFVCAVKGCGQDSGGVFLQFV